MIALCTRTKFYLFEGKLKTEIPNLDLKITSVNSPYVDTLTDVLNSVSLKQDFS